MAAGRAAGPPSHAGGGPRATDPVGKTPRLRRRALDDSKSGKVRQSTMSTKCTTCGGQSPDLRASTALNAIRLSLQPLTTARRSRASETSEGPEFIFVAAHLGSITETERQLGYGVLTALCDHIYHIYKGAGLPTGRCLREPSILRPRPGRRRPKNKLSLAFGSPEWSQRLLRPGRGRPATTRPAQLLPQRGTRRCDPLPSTLRSYKLRVDGSGSRQGLFNKIPLAEIAQW